MTLTDETVADAFDALGNPARLSVLRLLVLSGCDGMNVGELKKQLDMPASTLAHHLSTLAKAGIVSQERRGREVVNWANFIKIAAVTRYLTMDCCAGMASPACK